MYSIGEKKKWKQVNKRLSDLERRVQGQQMFNVRENEWYKMLEKLSNISSVIQCQTQTLIVISGSLKRIARWLEHKDMGTEKE